MMTPRLFHTLTLVLTATATVDVVALLPATAGGEYEELLRQVALELDRNVRTRTSEGAPPFERLVEQAEQLRDPIVVVLSNDASQVAAVRPSDRTVLQRTLPASSTTFARAVATAELVHLLETRTPPPPSRPTHVSFRIEAGLLTALSSGDESVLLHPALGAALVLQDWVEEPLDLELAVDALLPARFTRDEVRYRRFAAGFTVAAGWRIGIVTPRVAVRLEGAESRVAFEEEASRSRFVASVAAQLGLRVALVYGLDAGVVAGGSVVLNPSEFGVEDEVRIREGRFRPQFGLVVGWSPP